MEKNKNDLGLKRFKEINKYAQNFIMEQEAPLPAQPADPNAPPPAGDPGAMGTDALPPEGATEMPSLTGETETGEVPAEEEPEIDPETAGEDDTTEEVDVTELVDMVKSVKKQLDDAPKADSGVLQKMDGVFTKLGELEGKLGEMDSIIARIDQLGAKIEEMKPKTPVEKLEMRSLDSYPFNQNPTEFFQNKKDEMIQSGKNEYVLTKGDVENYGRNQIAKSFNPKAMENDYMF